MTFLTFRLDSHRFAMRLGQVGGVVRAAATTPVPDAPPALLGVLNLHGDMVPVVDIRWRFHLPPRPPRVEDRIVLATARDRTVAFFVDHVDGLVEFGDDQVREAGGMLPNLDLPLDGFGRFADETILLYSIENLYTADDLTSFEDAMNAAVGGSA